MMQAEAAFPPLPLASNVALAAWFAGADAAACFAAPFAPEELAPIARALWLLAYTLAAGRMAD